LRLVGYSSDDVLSFLDGLPGLVGYLARGILCSSALLLLAFLALLMPSGLGLGGARLLYGLLGLGGGGICRFSTLPSGPSCRLMRVPDSSSIACRAELSTNGAERFELTKA
jgi:hypothetical protein